MSEQKLTQCPLGIDKRLKASEGAIHFNLERSTLKIVLSTLGSAFVVCATFLIAFGVHKEQERERDATAAIQAEQIKSLLEGQAAAKEDRIVVKMQLEGLSNQINELKSHLSDSSGWAQLRKERADQYKRDHSGNFK